MCDLAYSIDFHSADSQEPDQNRLMVAHLPDSECEPPRCWMLSAASGPLAPTSAMTCSCEEGARYVRWIIGSAFEDGLSQLVQTGETDGLQTAATLTVQTYLGRTQVLGEPPLSFPASKSILAVLGGIEPVFRHEVCLGARPMLRLTLQRYQAADRLVEDLVREGQRIDMTGYIMSTLRYYEQHGSPCRDLEQRAALLHNSFSTLITPRNPSAPFILISYDERGRSRLGTHTRMFEEELAGIEKFGPPYYRLRATFLALEQEADRHKEHVRETLEELPLFHAGVVVAVGKSSAATERTP